MAETVQGPPCGKCGGTERYGRVEKGRKHGRCVTCRREHKREAGRRWLSDPNNCEYNRERMRQLRSTPEGKERSREASLRWRSGPDNRKHNLERMRQLRSTPEGRDSSREASRRWAREYPDKANAKSQRRRARKLKAMPDWLTPEQHEEIAAVYAEARSLTAETGVEHHVDHIIPLRGEGVSGLHVPCNLRVVPAEENLKKGNRLEAASGPSQPHINRSLFEV